MKTPVKAVLIAVVALTMCFAGSSAWATGLGVYFSYTTGSADWDADSGSSDWELDSDVGDVEFGVVLDTDLSTADIFNYRLYLGYESLTYDIKSTTTGNKTDELGLGGVALSNVFGFGVVRNYGFRLWLGPELRLAYGSGESDSGVDISMFNFGLGAVLGANFNPGQTVSLSATLGARYNIGVGSGDDANFDYDYNLSGVTYGATMAILFRMGEY